MAIIYSYPTVTPTANDLVLGTDVDNTGKATRNFTVQSIIDLVTVTGNNLQDVLNNGNISVGRDIILGTVQDPTQTIYANSFSTGVASIIGGVGQNFTDFTSTRITGTLQTGLQPSITSIGTLVNLKVGNATPAITSIVTTFTNPGTDLALATTKAIVDYVATTPNPETLAQTLVSGNITGGKDIVVSAADDITFTDTSKIILGTGSDATIEHDGTDLKIANVFGKTTISNTSGDIDISATAVARKLNLNGKAGVELQFDTGKRFETLTGGAKVSGTFESTGVGTLNGIVNTNSYTASNGVGTAGQILSSTVTGTSWIADPNPTPYSWLVEADSGAGSPYTVANGNQIHFKGGTNISTSWNNTDKEVLISLSGTSVTGSGAANQVTYWDGTQTITGAAGLTFAGGATGKVAIAGELEVGGVLTDGTFTGSNGTYTGFASITSTVFVGPLQGNADTATALVATGSVSMSGDTVAAGVTYTSGGNVPLVSTISDSVVYNKELAGFNETNGSVADGDSILEALEKLQGQITNLPQGIVYQGVWNPGTSATSGGTPDLRLAANKINGHYYIVSTIGIGTPNGDGTTPNDWDVRDWCVFADDGAGGGADEWQKIDNSSLAGGTGTANTMTKWLTNQTIGNSTITDDGSTVTIADTIDFITKGNNTFGNTSADTTLMKGNTTLEQNLILAKGLSLGTDYGTAGQALISGGGINVVNTWADLTVGTVTSVSATTTGDALDVAVSTATTTPAIALTWAGGASGATKYVNGLGNLITFPTVDNYVSWTIEADDANTEAITTGAIVDFVGVGNVSTAWDATTNELRISASENPGTGTQYTLPVWATTSTLGNSMVSQNAGATALAIAGSATFTNDVTIDNSSPELYLTPDSAKYSWMIAAQENVDQHFEITPSTAVGGTTFNAPALKINGADSAATFAGNTQAQKVTSTAGFFTTGNIATPASGTSALIMDYYLGNSRFWSRGADATTRGTFQFIQLENDGGNQTTSLLIDASRNATFAGDINIGAAKKLKFNANSFITPENNTSGAEISTAGTFIVKTGSTPALGFTLDASQNATFEDDVEIKGNLTVDGIINHGGGGGGTAKGGTFTKLFTSISGGSTAFTINRSGTGAMVFDVMLTSDTSSTTSIAKKFTVVNTFGNAIAPIFNKILDTGPDASGADFTVAFAKDGSADTRIKCTITPATTATQKIGITIDLGFGQNDATVVMNA